MKHAVAATSAQAQSSRRHLLQRLGSVALVGAPALACGWWLTLGLRSALPRSTRPARLFVGPLGEQPPGRRLVRTPAGGRLMLVRAGRADAAHGLVALSTRCPHLGCRVHWHAGRDRYECPCHGGSFDAEGRPLAGPPLAQRASLLRYPVQVEGDFVFVLLPPEELAPERSRTGRRVAFGART